MPNYLYECPIHGEFEWSHSIKDQLNTCPLCEDDSRSECHPPKTVKRLIAGSTNFVLMGGGWAKDRYH